MSDKSALVFHDGADGPDDLEHNIGFLLRLAQLAVFQDLIIALRPWGLRVTDFSVLMIIGREPGLNQQAVSAALKIQPPNLAAIVERLRRQNLIRRSPVAADRRSHALQLTPDGEALLASANRAHADHTERLLALIEDLDVPTVREALKRIARF